MEGGETMVAIIQNLRDAGMAVTLMSGSSLQKCQKPCRRYPVAKVSVETSTDTPKRHASEQICDSHYTSSYQMAHCRMKPSSPEPRLSEFPVQRRAPTWNKGSNFTQVNSFGCGETSSADFRYRSRGSFYSPSDCMPAASSAFVHSLRKYPLPGRSASTELVQRLLNYTQNKHLSRNNSLSLRSLASRPCRSSKYKKSTHNNKQKNMQTHTRPLIDEPVEKTKNSRIPLNDQFSENYNYLNASRSGGRNFAGRYTEVRYISNVKQFIKEYLRQMVQQPPVLCPRVRSRYAEHRRVYHRQTNSATNPNANESHMNTEPIRADVPTAAKVKRTDRCLGTTASIGICPKVVSRFNDHRRRYHGEVIPKETKESQVHMPGYCIPPPGTRILSSSCCAPCKPCKTNAKPSLPQKEPSHTDIKDSDGTQLFTGDDIEKEVLEWVTELPTYENNTPENKNLFIEKAHGLINQLKAMRDRPDFDEKALEAINDYLDNLPVSTIKEEAKESENVREVFNTWIANLCIEDKKQLFDLSVDCLTQRTVKTGAKDDLKKGKLLPERVNENLGLNQQLHDVGQNKAENRKNSSTCKHPISDWVRYTDVIPGDVKKQVENLAKQADVNLIQLINENGTYDDFKNCINNFFDSLPNEDIPLTFEEKGELIDNFTNNIKDADIKYKSVNYNTKEKLAQNLLKKLKTKNYSKVNAGTSKRNDFDYFSERTILAPDQKSTGPSRDISTNIMYKPNALGQQPAFQWLQNDPTIPENIKKNNLSLIKHFDKKLQELKAEGASDDVIQDEIKEFLSSLSNKGLKLTQSQKYQFGKDILNQTKSKPSASTQPTSDWLGNGPNISLEITNKNTKFDKKLQQLTSKGVSDDVIKKESNQFLSSLPNNEFKLTQTQKIQLSKNLLGKIITKSRVSKQPSSSWIENASNISKEIEKTNKDIVKNFDQKLKRLRSKGASDAIIEDEIDDFIDSLPHSGIKLTQSKQDQLATDLFNQSKTISGSDNNPVTDWMENNPDISKENKKKNKAFVSNFDKKLQQLKEQGASNDVIQKEIDKFLSTLSNNEIKLTPSQKDQLGKNLFSKTKSKSNSSNQTPSDQPNAPYILEDVKNGTKNSTLKQLRSEDAIDDFIEDKTDNFIDSLPNNGIMPIQSKQDQLATDIFKKSKTKSDLSSNLVNDYLGNANIPEETKQEIKISLQGFEKKVQQMRFEGVNEEDIQEEINDFLNSLPQEGNSFTPSEHNQLSKDLIRQSKPKQEHKQIVSNRSNTDYLQNTPHVKSKNKSNFDKFGKKLQQLRSEGASDDISQEEINTTQGSPPYKGIKVTQPKQDQFGKDLFSQTKYNLKTKRNANNELVADLLQNAPYISEEMKQKNKNFINEFEKKMQQLKSEGASDDVIQEEVNIFLNSLPNKGTKLTQSKQDQLANDLSGKTKSQSPKSSLDYAPNISDEIKQIDENVFNTFDKKLQQLRSQVANDKEIQGEIDDFLGSLSQKGILLSPSKHDQLANDFLSSYQSQPGMSSQVPTDLLENAPKISKDTMKKNKKLRTDFGSPSQQLQSTKREVFQQTKPRQDKQNTQQTTDCSKCVQNLTKESKSKSNAKYENFDERTLKLQSENDNDDVIQEKVKRSFSSLSDNEGKLSPIKKARLNDRILSEDKSNCCYKNQFIQRKRWNQSEQTDENTSDTISHLLDKLPFDIPSDSKREIKNKINDLLATNINGLSSLEIKAAIDKILKEEANLSSHDLNGIASALINGVKEKPPPVTDTNDRSAINKPRIQKMVKNEINDMLNDFDIPDSLKENILNALANQIDGDISDDETQKLIKCMLKEANVSEDDARQIIDKLIAKNKKMHKYLSSDLKYEQELKNIIKSWIFDTLINLHDEVFIDNMAQKLARNIVETEKYEQQNKIIRTNEEKNGNLRNQIVQWLDKYVDDVNLPNITDIDTLIVETNGITSDLKLKSNPKAKSSDRFVKEAVNQWVNSLEIRNPESIEEIINNEKTDLTKTLLDTVFNGKNVTLKHIEETFYDATEKFLKNIPKHSYHTENINVLSKRLQNLVNDCQNKYSVYSIECIKKKATDVLLDDIANWVKNLPLESDTPENKIEFDRIRQQLETKIIHKIGELNLYPEISNDDFVYEDLLGDEIDNLLINLHNENINKNQLKLKNELLHIVRKARQMIREENAGQIYKQQLRDAIARTLPYLELSEERKAAFEVLKDVIVDTYINMHYVGGDQKEICKLQKKTNDVIYQFYTEHLQNCPALTFDSGKLNESIYNTLECIHEPQNEFFKDEIELVKIKLTIMDWIKQLPLKTQTDQEKLRLSKIISVLAKKIRDLENMRKNISSLEFHEKIKNEIMLFLKKLSLDCDQDRNINYFADILHQNLEDTEETRRLNASHRHSIQFKKSCLFWKRSAIPPCCLSKEDQDHLKRIRNRSPVMKGNILKNDEAYVPRSVDACSQTDVNSPHGSSSYRNKSLCQKNSFAQTPCKNTLAVGSQINESTNTIDCRWDSSRGNNTNQSQVPYTHFKPCFSSTAISQRPASPGSLSPYAPRTPKPCVNRPSTSHHTSQMNFSNLPAREPCSSLENQLPYRPIPCNPEETSQVRLRVPCSPTVPYRMSGQSNSSPRESQPYPYRLPQSPSPYSSYPCDTHTDPSSELDPRRTNRYRSQNYSPRQSYNMPYESGQRIGLGTSSPYNTYPGSPSQSLLRTQRPYQVSQPRTCEPRLPFAFGGQPCLTPQSSDPFSSQMNRSRSPYSSQMKAEPTTSSTEYETGPSCSFQKRVTHLGSFDDVPPQTNPRLSDWDKRGRNRSISEEEYQRDAKSCRCKSKCGKHNDRRKPSHLYDDKSLKRCSKCCGIHCPYPSYELYFR